ncbi:MAG: disulfide bond formation protein DsbA [Marivirga sp.]|nr:disulfide bond formation protein DsbA [Marivirga sp.]
MNKLTPPVNKNDKQTGSPDYTITLVEYGDYQCPYCRRAYPLVKRLLEERGDVIRFVFRNFPLQTIHPHAMSAALAAEAASHQNQFWEMHDLLFENQERFGDHFFSELAVKLGLDMHWFQRDFSSESASSIVNADFKSGLHSGVNGTPSFFIDDNKIWLPELSYEALLHAVDKHLNSPDKNARSKTSRTYGS